VHRPAHHRSCDTHLLPRRLWQQQHHRSSEPGQCQHIGRRIDAWSWINYKPAMADPHGPVHRAFPEIYSSWVPEPDRRRLAWQETYGAHPAMYGDQLSAAAVHAAGVFRMAGAREVMELGAGHGRDALFFARSGFAVRATDFARPVLSSCARPPAGRGWGRGGEHGGA
jgi:hypothetical protein